MGEPIYPRYNSRGKYHRRKSVLGKDWTPARPQDVGAGVWCPRCHVRHSYNGRDKVIANYELRGKAWVLSWLCPHTGDFLQDVWLNT